MLNFFSHLESKLFRVQHDLQTSADVHRSHLPKRQQEPNHPVLWPTKLVEQECNLEFYLERWYSIPETDWEWNLQEILRFHSMECDVRLQVSQSYRVWNRNWNVLFTSTKRTFNFLSAWNFWKVQLENEMFSLNHKNFHVSSTDQNKRCVDMAAASGLDIDSSTHSILKVLRSARLKIWIWISALMTSQNWIKKNPENIILNLP